MIQLYKPRYPTNRIALLDYHGEGGTSEGSGSLTFSSEPAGLWREQEPLQTILRDLSIQFWIHSSVFKCRSAEHPSQEVTSFLTAISFPLFDLPHTLKVATLICVRIMGTAVLAQNGTQVPATTTVITMTYSTGEESTTRHIWPVRPELPIAYVDRRSSRAVATIVSLRVSGMGLKILLARRTYSSYRTRRDG